jgi:Pentapeptide repeats (9 copies)
MNQEPTLARFALAEAARQSAIGAGGTDIDAHAAATKVWNSWALQMQTDRHALEQSGAWQTAPTTTGHREPLNTETREWMQAAAAVFSTKDRPFSLPVTASMDEWLFPFDAFFEAATFTAATFRKTRFEGEASFTEANFATQIDFHETVFRAEVKFNGATFSGDVLFCDGMSKGDVKLPKDVDFTGAHFLANAEFGSTIFAAEATFNGALFVGNAGFRQAEFEGASSFKSAEFGGSADFSSATFVGRAWFDRTKYAGPARFDKATFKRLTTFESAYFHEAAGFKDVTFMKGSRFTKAIFAGLANFHNAKFRANTSFQETQFQNSAEFNGAVFIGYAYFNAAKFAADARFKVSTFEGQVSFENVHFGGDANFHAMRCLSSFSLARAVFDGVPEFIQAEFPQPARLSNVRIHRRRIDPGAGWSHPLRSLKLLMTRRDSKAAIDNPERYRWLKRLAQSSNDLDRELEFLAGEIRSARWVTEFPLPLTKPNSKRLGWLRHIPFVFWRPRAWTASARYWFGVLYGALSDFGRSVFRPLILWLSVTAIAAGIYLGESPEVMTSRDNNSDRAFSVRMFDYVASVSQAAALRQPCTEGQRGKVTILADTGKHFDTTLSLSSDLVGLSKAVRDQTDAVSEAIRLAVTNATVISGSESAHRMYGCLYGIEKFGDNPIAHVPGVVASVGAAQKLVSALLIFLFGLAIRNMLRIK